VTDRVIIAAIASIGFAWAGAGWSFEPPAMNRSRSRQVGDPFGVLHKIDAYFRYRNDIGSGIAQTTFGFPARLPVFPQEPYSSIFQ
jgi:hypothetical protein